MIEKETTQVREWWNKKPFTYKGAFGVGEQVNVESLDLNYFENIEKRFRKHSSSSVQEIDTPLLSKFINYQDLKNKKVLDIATGTGLMAVSFAKYGADVTAIDLTPYAAETAKQNFKVRNLPGTVLQMDAQNLQFPDNTFDFVCAHGCFMHMPDTSRALNEIYRVLKPGGQVYAWMYHKGWYYWFGIIFVRGILLGKLFSHRFNTLALTSRYSDGLHEGGNPHTKFFSRNGFRKLFQNSKFEDINVVANYNPSEWLAWPLKRFSFGWLIPQPAQRFLSERMGWSFSCTIIATKESK